MYDFYKPDDWPENEEEQPDIEDKKPENGIEIKHDKGGLAIYITIYNTNNNANEDSEAGLRQIARESGQISGERGQNASQGGQIAGKCGQNANQDGEVELALCGSNTGEAAGSASPLDEVLDEDNY